MFGVKGLTIIHKKDLTTLVEGLSFTLSPGERAALIGEEGNGKSIVLKLLFDPSLIEPYAEWSGEIMGRQLRKGYLSQELTPQELRESVWAFCQKAPSFERSSPKALDDAARSTGLDAALFWDDRPLGTLSGGERVKLRLALLLLEHPDVLLLDEPSNDLDLSTLLWLEQYLLACKIPVLYISHDEALLRRTATTVIHLERLRRRALARCTVARTGYAQYVNAREAGFARQERQARKELAEYDEKMRKYRQIRDKVEHQQAVITRGDPAGARLLKKKMHSVLSTGKRFEREKEDMTAMPEWEEAILTAFDEERSSVPAGKEVLRLEVPVLAAGECVLARGVRLQITGPERIGIIGPNGAGKTTLLKLAADRLLPRTDLRAAYMPQDYGDSILGDKTPVELLAPSASKEAVTRARALLGSMKYKAEEMEHPAAMLSGGQRAKLLFLSMIQRGANVLVLDEPTRNFSPLSAPVIRAVLARFSGAILSVSHDRVYLREVCTSVWELTPDGLREAPAWP